VGTGTGGHESIGTGEAHMLTHEVLSATQAPTRFPCTDNLAVLNSARDAADRFGLWACYF